MALNPVTNSNFTAEVLESEQPVLVDFWAAWCPPCRLMNPILDELNAERDDIKVVSVDAEHVTVDFNGDTATLTRSVAETVSVLADPSPPPRTALPEQLVLAKERYGR